MESNILTSILAVFRAVSGWIVESVTGIVPMFYAEGALTFIGVLAVSGLAFAVAFLLINVVRSFLRFE